MRISFCIFLFSSSSSSICLCKSSLFAHRSSISGNQKYKNTVRITIRFPIILQAGHQLPKKTSLTLPIWTILRWSNGSLHSQMQILIPIGSWVGSWNLFGIGSGNVNQRKELGLVNFRTAKVLEVGSRDYLCRSKRCKFCCSWYLKSKIHLVYF